MPEFSKRQLTIAALTVLVFAGLYFIFRTPPIPVDTATIEKAKMAVTVDEEGVTKVKEIFMVSAPVAGRLKRSLLKVGDKVTENKTLVATIEPAAPSFLDERSRSAAQASVNAAKSAAVLSEARVSQAEAELQFARQDLKRASKLAARKTISVRALDQARMNEKIKDASLKSAKAELQVSIEKLASARANLIEPSMESQSSSASCCVKIMAPTSGRVLKLIKQSQQIVHSGETILEIGDPVDLEIVVDLLSSDATKVKAGMTAMVEGWGGETVLRARVRRVEPTGFKKISALGIEEQRVNVRLDFEDQFKRWATLGHDFRVFVRIEIWQKDGVLQLPLSALFRDKDTWAVFVMEDGKARQRVIEIDHRNQRTAEITKGLREGEKVVLHPNNQIEDGVAIMERQELR